jgi:hypothetical protein
MMPEIAQAPTAGPEWARFNLDRADVSISAARLPHIVLHNPGDAGAESSGPYPSPAAIIGRPRGPVEAGSGAAAMGGANLKRLGSARVFPAHDFSFFVRDRCEFFLSTKGALA